MNHDITIRITGEAGQGIQTIGSALCRICTDSCLEFIANQDYMSRVRGGNNYYQIRIADKIPLAFKESIDILVPLSAEGITLHRKNLTPDGKIIVDKEFLKLTDDSTDYLDVPFNALALESGGESRYQGSVVIGLLAGIAGVEFETVEIAIHKTLTSKGDDVALKNIECARTGFRIGIASSLHRSPKSRVTETAHYLLDGNQAVAAGAAYAGCRFYAGYPMTPSTTIMETMAGFTGQFPIVVEQAEDEIAAINMIIGASYAGVRSMTATSGGGFALMTEGISLAAMTETPVVIVNGQRPGPATGLPTRTEQADLDLVLYAGHGEFARAVYAPGDIEEAFQLTITAFDVADRFQIPAIILTDQYFSDMIYAAPIPQIPKLSRQRHILSRHESVDVSGYKRYKLTDSGISPRAVPSWITDVIYADSDEHTEEGHITESGDLRIAMVDKRFSAKLALLRKEILDPVCIQCPNAQLIILGFGSTKGVIQEVAHTHPNLKIGAIHIPQVWPFPAEILTGMLHNAIGARIITVENNAGAQLANLIKRETNIKIDTSILKYNGRPFTIDELTNRIDKYWRNYGC